MTAEEAIKEWIDKPQLENLHDGFVNCLEQYAKAKVLEALEEKNVQIANKQLEALEYHLPRYQRWMDDRASIEVTGEEFEAFKKQSKAYIEECIITKQS